MFMNIKKSDAVTVFRFGREGLLIGKELKDRAPEIVDSVTR